GPCRAELEEQVSRLGLDEAVQLVGPATDVLPYYRAADVFALLSHGEASPIAPLEAMAVGLPLVVAQQRPFDEVIDSRGGVMVAEDKAEEVAQAMGGFWAAPRKARAAGNAGRERACRHFSWDRIADQYLHSS